MKQTQAVSLESPCCRSWLWWLLNGFRGLLKVTELFSGLPWLYWSLFWQDIWQENKSFPVSTKNVCWSLQQSQDLQSHSAHWKPTGRITQEELGIIGNVMTPSLRFFDPEDDLEPSTLLPSIHNIPRFLPCLGFNPGSCAHQASPLMTELYP